ncbi:carboxypeptidase regulatory-like domain-containing protein [Thermus caldifontis]|uniref:carboxypeptidase regulatory-like domain-containing protein n=1 Tax=Thermus caldifontis TaxID=1930763 RepID=UPI000DF40E2A|nr:carboxypeptidase regulatory-like domain-containing protein [Thermus caldifontis]
MKGVRLKALGLALLGALGLLFAGCGQQQPGQPQTGTLEVTVQETNGAPIQGASVSVNGVPGTQLTNAQGKASFTLTPGDYTVNASKAGYNPGSTQATVTAGQTAQATITLTKIQTPPPSGYRIGSIELLSGFPKDASGLLPLNQEENPHKDVNLYAAQTEEPVCFRFQVKDEQGNPVGEGVRVKVESFEYGGVTVDVSFGCEPNLQGRDYGYTDAQGQVYFTVNALYSNIIQNVFLPEPIKFTAVATDERTQTAARTEFKVWFFNISHLYFAHEEGNQLPFQPETAQMAPTRTGHDFGAITNIFNQNRDLMAHTFTSFVRLKQPAGEAFYPGASLPWVDNSTYEMVYTLMGGDVNDVQWVAGCDSGAGTTCVDFNGSGVVLNLKPTVTLQDLPKEVQVKATMRVTVEYGDSIYTFDLKDYTFTKRWVGAYLTVNKYVDNHVLTWYGPDRTLSASSQTFDGNYTSTVHIVVTNPSQSPMYNVTIRDALPPELGVVTSKITDNGTYDPVNHVVTWNYSQFAALQQVDPGETVEVTFQVYVRQKPGFCADPSLVGPNYVVPALYGAGGIASQAGANDCQRPYDDPYKVTNGLQINDVTASGFLQPNGQGPQLLFDYTPVADESDIWAVRPIFDIDKQLKSASPITQGASALFEIAVTHEDRTESEAAYGALEALYPWEFGDNTQGTGHRSPTYQLRTNTYAHDLEVTDAFEVGLDFTDASDFVGAGLLSGGAAQPYDPVVGKRFEWTPMSIQAGSTVTAQIFLTGNLPTPEDEVWDNCAFLGAPQLNQPANVTGTAYYGPWVPGRVVWSKNQLTYATEVTGTDGSFNTSPALSDAEVQGRIHSCAGVEVVPPPPSPYLSLTSHGEYNRGTNGSDPFADPTGTPIPGDTVNNTNPGGTPTEGIPVNSTFWYKGTIFNTGAADATGVTYTATLTGTTYVNFVNSPATRIYVLDATNIVQSILSPSTFTSTSVTFSGFNIPAGGLARVVIEARGVAVGQQEYFRQEVTYSNNTYPQPLPLVTQETTTIAP